MCIRAIEICVRNQVLTRALAEVSLTGNAPKFRHTVDVSGVDTWLVGFGHDYFGRVEPVLMDLQRLITRDLDPKARGLVARDGHWVLGSR